MTQNTETTARRDYSDIAWRYCEDVVSGKIPACLYVQAACHRTLDDWEASQNDDTYPYTYDPVKAQHACFFIENMCHVEGEYANTLIVLQPWQVWIMTQVFGWICNSGRRRGMRRYRRVYIEVPKGNGKSLMSSPVGLYMLSATTDNGAQVYSAATSQIQARIVFDVARQMALNPASQSLLKRCGVKVNAHTITVPSKFNRFMPLSAEGDRLDGKNVSLVIVDELHAHPDRRVWDNLVSGAAKRPQSLIWAITTAGFDLGGIGYEQRSYITSILDGTAKDDSVFGVIYTIDANDAWQDESTWIKANPNWGVSVDPDAFAGAARQAISVSSTQPNFMTKHLNVWCSDSSRWADKEAWQNALDKKLKIEDMDPKAPCFIGLDLSSHTDMTAKVILFEQKINEESHYYIFPTFYLPDAAIKKGRNASYPGWVKDGYLTKQEGETIDLAQVEADIVKDCETYNVKEICFDKWESRQLIQTLMAKDLPVIEIPQNVMTLSEPTKLLDTVVLNKRLHYANPILFWNAMNVFVRVDTNGNIKPKKESESSPNKIDGVAATLNALVRSMEIPKESRYAKEGFRIF